MKKLFLLIIIVIVSASGVIYFLFKDEINGTYSIYKIAKHKNTIIKLAQLKSNLPTAIDLKLYYIDKIKKDKLVDKLVNSLPAKGEIASLADDMPDSKDEENIIKLFNRKKIIVSCINILPKRYRNNILDLLNSINTYTKNKGGLEHIYETLPEPFIVDLVYNNIPKKYKKNLATNKEYRYFIERLPSKDFLRALGNRLLNLSGSKL